MGIKAEGLQMTIIDTPERLKKRKRTASEGKIQAECFRWFWNNHARYRGLMFHVPNENDRTDSNPIQGAIRKSMGVIAGVSDLILLVPTKKYHGLCIEMKDEDGRQRQSQKDWQIMVEMYGYRYEVCRSLEQFKEIITDYLYG